MATRKTLTGEPRGYYTQTLTPEEREKRRRRRATKELPLGTPRDILQGFREDVSLGLPEYLDPTYVPQGDPGSMAISPYQVSGGPFRDDPPPRTLIGHRPHQSSGRFDPVQKAAEVNIVIESQKETAAPRRSEPVVEEEESFSWSDVIGKPKIRPLGHRSRRPKETPSGISFKPGEYMWDQEKETESGISFKPGEYMWDQEIEDTDQSAEASYKPLGPSDYSMAPLGPDDYSFVEEETVRKPRAKAPRARAPSDETPAHPFEKPEVYSEEVVKFTEETGSPWYEKVIADYSKANPWIRPASIRAAVTRVASDHYRRWSEGLDDAAKMDRSAYLNYLYGEMRGKSATRRSDAQDEKRFQRQLALQKDRTRQSMKLRGIAKRARKDGMSISDLERYVTASPEVQKYLAPLRHISSQVNTWYRKSLEGDSEGSTDLSGDIKKYAEASDEEKKKGGGLELAKRVQGQIFKMSDFYSSSFPSSVTMPDGTVEKYPDREKRKLALISVVLKQLDSLREDSELSPYSNLSEEDRISLAISLVDSMAPVLGKGKQPSQRKSKKRKY